MGTGKKFILDFVHEKAFKQGSGTIYQWNLMLHKAKLNVIRIVLTFVWAFNMFLKKVMKFEPYP